VDFGNKTFIIQGFGDSYSQYRILDGKHLQVHHGNGKWEMWNDGKQKGENWVQEQYLAGHCKHWHSGFLRCLAASLAACAPPHAVDIY
jgi:hypothetical protein